MSNLADRLLTYGNEFGAESSFLAINPRDGLGIASKEAPTAYSATAGLLSVYNSELQDAPTGTNGAIHVWPDKLSLTATQHNTGASGLRFVGMLDKPGASRWSSGGTALTSNQRYRTKRSGYVERTAKAQIYFGDLTLTAETDADCVFDEMVSNDVLAINDVIELCFGGGGPKSFTSGVYSIPIQAFTIAPGCTLTIHPVSLLQTQDAAFTVSFYTFEWGF